MFATVRTVFFARFQHTWLKPEGFDTGIKVYNCILKEKVPFVVRDKHFVGWYTCGPTVYDSAHLGHATCYIKFDIIQRILKDRFKLNLVTVMNITDIDDKIIKRSHETNKSWKEIAVNYEKEFWEDFQSLKIRKPDVIVRVSECMPAIQDFIKKLLKNEKAYRTSDGSVYFDVNKHDTYGKLVNITKENAIHEENHLKKSPNDFVLWKTRKEGEPYWDSNDFHPGRPGWHIECSTIAATTLGSIIDVHAGGIDLKFPHHENEETQSCAYFSKKQWVNYWLHTGHLHLKNTEKMSKSLKNTVTIRNFLQKYNAETLRFTCLMSNYRNAMEYSDETFLNAEKTLQNFKFFINNCNAYIKGQLNANINSEILQKALADATFTIDNALKDDFDTATVIKSLHALVTNVNKMLHSNTSSENHLNDVTPVIAICNYITNIFNLFGINLNSSTVTNEEPDDFFQLLDILLNFRQSLREIGISRKDANILKLCDGVRDNVKKCGVTINDSGKISTWTK